MRLNIPLSLAAIALSFAALPALADGTTSGKPAVTGNDNAVQRIEAATARHVDILTALLSKLPAQAQPATEIARRDYAVCSDGRYNDHGVDEHEVLRREVAAVVVDERQVAEIRAEGSGCVIDGFVGDRVHHGPRRSRGR